VHNVDEKPIEFEVRGLEQCSKMA